MKIIRELNKKFLVYFYTIYTTSTSPTYVICKFTILLPQGEYAVIIPLILWFQFLLLYSKPMISYHMIHHMTVVTCLFIIQEIEKEIKSNKIKIKYKGLSIL